MAEPRTVLVTGGAGFIGSAVIRMLIAATPHRVINADKLTYSANLESLAAIKDDPRYIFERVDIADTVGVRRIFDRHQPGAVLHLAAESHVDRSIDRPADFVQTNVTGTFTLLEAALRHYERTRTDFRFIHVSTDEVFGSLGESGRFDATSPYNPSSPYAASKAAADHLVRAWQRTYGLPVIISNCSNNYGPYQFPEKLIPLMIIKALREEPLPIYGGGQNVRDWLYVNDHAAALILLLEKGVIGETYLIGGENEQRNIDVVTQLCAILDELRPRAGKYEELIEFVEDRPGHDLRYAIDATKIKAQLGWQPSEGFAAGLRKTVEWYLANEAWWQRVLSGEYRGERLGVRA